VQHVEIDFEPGAHDCHLYRGWSERAGVVRPFVRDGLERDEYCLIVTNPKSADTWRSDLKTFGVDVDEAEQRGALEFASGENWREPLSNGAPNSIIMARNTLEMLAALLTRFSGVRIVGDAEWDHQPPVHPDVLCHWEATANLVFEESNVRVICQYDVNHYAPAMLHAAMRTHPSVIWDGRRRSNPGYQAHQILAHEPHLNRSGSNSHGVDEMLANLGS
jgi:hypothetical protein